MTRGVLCAALALLCACQRTDRKDEPTATATATAPAKTVRVAIRAMQFVPAELELARGDTVIWTNEDLVPHSVTADDRQFDSGSLAANATWRYIVQGSGSDRDSAPRHYHCVFHPAMQGSLHVRP